MTSYTVELTPEELDELIVQSTQLYKLAERDPRVPDEEKQQRFDLMDKLMMLKVRQKAEDEPNDPA